MKDQRKEIPATLVDKKAQDYFPIPGRVPQPVQIYELHFDTKEGHIMLEVSSFEYDVVEIGDSGLLVYEGKKLISFGDIIKEFHM